MQLKKYYFLKKDFDPMKMEALTECFAKALR